MQVSNNYTMSYNLKNVIIKWIETTINATDGYIFKSNV